MSHAADLDHFADDIYIYLNFDQIRAYRAQADSVTIPAVNIDVLEEAN